MTTALPWHKRTIKRLAALALLVVAAVLFVMSPFYARAILWGLNKIPVTVNQVAAASQKGDGRIEETEQPEPGSPEWQQQQQRIADEQAQQLLKQFDQQKVAQPASSSANDKTSNPISVKKVKENEKPDVPSLVETLAKMQDDYQLQKQSVKNTNSQSGIHVGAEVSNLNSQKKLNKNQAHVIVVLGGGLGRDAAHNIVVNAYTRLRLEKAVRQKQYNPLPILLSGVEAPYMQNWLKAHQVDAGLLENRSMNTCENTRFSALLLQKKGGAPRVELITDAYHMPRARRLFAMNGIDTIPVVAPLPNVQTRWKPSKSNLMHSRRATYEAIASIRDLWFGETNCREVP
ncbi:MAG: YdcF family protein [Moraxellaceae bacterium]|nr:MAG: YdcF family protein [Moraxellaceae bacterium]